MWKPAYLCSSRLLVLRVYFRRDVASENFSPLNKRSTLFSVLFTRMREHEVFGIASKGISQYSANSSTAAVRSVDYFAYETPLNFRYDLNLTNGSLITYEDKFELQQSNGDSLTQLIGWNLMITLQLSIRSGGLRHQSPDMVTGKISPSRLTERISSW
jgi:hypothetical protein